MLLREKACQIQLEGQILKKEQSKEKAQKHTEAMERLYSKEIKKSIEETRVYKTDFFRNETAGKGAGFLLEQS